MLLDGATNQRQEGRQPFRFERTVAAYVVHAFGDRRLIEERHPFQMREHPRMRFREQRHIEGTPAAGGVIEARLIGKNRLACSGRALHDINTGRQESPLEDVIQSIDSGGAAV